jgi:hypothetical protein
VSKAFIVSQIGNPRMRPVINVALDPSKRLLAVIKVKWARTAVKLSFEPMTKFVEPREVYERVSHALRRNPSFCAESRCAARKLRRRFEWVGVAGMRRLEQVPILFWRSLDSLKGQTSTSEVELNLTEKDALKRFSSFVD